MADREAELVTIRRFDDLQQVGDGYRSHRIVEVSLEHADSDLVVRVLDFATGLVHVDGGALKRVDDRRYQLIPRSASGPGRSGDREPRRPLPLGGADSAVAPLPASEPAKADALGFEPALVVGPWTDA